MKRPLLLPKVRTRLGFAASAAAAVIATRAVVVVRPASASAARAKTAAIMTGTPMSTSVRVTPATIGGGGGTATIVAKLKKSVSCQLKVAKNPRLTTEGCWSSAS
jgi:hypothetical protein